MNSQSYWSISRLNTVRKIVETVLAARISYMATIHNFSTKTQFGSQRGSFVKEEIHHLLEKIYATWNENKIASLLMMDVPATYLNTSH